MLRKLTLSLILTFGMIGSKPLLSLVRLEPFKAVE